MRWQEEVTFDGSAVTANNWRVTAFQAPSTLNRCRSEAARTKIRVNDHRQHRNVLNTKCAASTKNTCPCPASDLLTSLITRQF